MTILLHKIEGYSLGLLPIGDINGIYQHYDIPHKNATGTDGPVLKEIFTDQFFVDLKEKDIFLKKIASILKTQLKCVIRLWNIL